MTTVHSAKKELRKLMLKNLSKIPPEALREQSSKVFATLMGLPEYLAAQKISIYLSMSTGEVSTTPIVRDALDRGKAVFVPYLHKYKRDSNGAPSSVMDMLKLQSVKEFESLKHDKWGIPSLSSETIEGREHAFGGRGVEDKTRDWSGGLDLILMPGVAFDLEMRRLGHGKGYYDFFLHRYQDALRGQMPEAERNQKHNPFLVGLVLDQQLLPAGKSVPTDSTDWRVDGLILGDGRILRR